MIQNSSIHGTKVLMFDNLRMNINRRRDIHTSAISHSDVTATSPLRYLSQHESTKFYITTIVDPEQSLNPEQGLSSCKRNHQHSNHYLLSQSCRPVSAHPSNSPMPAKAQKNPKKACLLQPMAKEKHGPLQPPPPSMSNMWQLRT